jgi:hypothetical protein
VLCAFIPVAMAKPAASSDEWLMRRPEDKRSSDFVIEDWIFARLRWLFKLETLVFTTRDMISILHD